MLIDLDLTETCIKVDVLFGSQKWTVMFKHFIFNNTFFLNCTCSTLGTDLYRNKIFNFNTFRMTDFLPGYTGGENTFNESWCMVILGHSRARHETF